MKEKKVYTVPEFVDKYVAACNSATDAARKKLLGTLDIIHYASYATKMQIAEKLVANGIKRKDNLIIRNTPALEMAKAIGALILYVRNLEVSTEDPVADYDLLVSSGAYQVIYGMIGSDVEVYNTVFDQTKEDVIANLTSPQAYIDRLVVSAISMLDKHLNDMTAIFNDENIKALAEQIKNSVATTGGGENGRS